MQVGKAQLRNAFQFKQRAFVAWRHLQQSSALLRESAALLCAHVDRKDGQRAFGYWRGLYEAEKFRKTLIMVRPDQ